MTGPPRRPSREPSQARAKLPAWAWPAIAVLSLLLGLAGGALAAALVVHENGGSVAGGVLGVERRTAAPLPADNGSIAAVAAKVLPSTVQIVAEYQGNDNGATGSGFVFDKQGHIITNNHVVAEADKDGGPIEIIDQDGNHSKATVVGRSTVYDIAVLKAEGAKKLTPAAIGSADQMRVGETVVAIGSPLGLSATVTSGIISAVNRPVTTGEGANDNSYINAVQTDAAINPGNSGGPLVNLQGQVVGVNSAIASLGSQVASDQGGNIGVGFAIPIEQVRVTTAQILRTGKAQYPVIGANVRATATPRRRHGGVDQPRRSRGRRQARGGRPDPQDRRQAGHRLDRPGGRHQVARPGREGHPDGQARREDQPGRGRPGREDRLSPAARYVGSVCWSIQRRERAQRLGDHDRVVALGQPEVRRRVDLRMTVAADRQQGRRVVGPQLRRELVHREPDELGGQRDPVELGALATRDDVGDQLGQPGVERGAGEQPRGDP